MILTCKALAWLTSWALGQAALRQTASLRATYSDSEGEEDERLQENSNTPQGATLHNGGVAIPPEPPGQCPGELQDKIARLYKKIESDGLDMNMLIQQRKEFRNPSIYERLIKFCSIDELGTNYPPDRFDPVKWRKDSYYEELALVQRARKAEIEIVSGTAKRKRWDQVATGGAAAATVKPTVLLSQPTLTTITSSSAKSTVLSTTIGSLPKKRL
ncbi:PREDICTED: SAP30-binding protein-like [Vollenhovia emeryi]|uniref:SAP30-binding protein-like n=1 Tax=Vollenhovia emeryi TaxID=411798 RepID=UPI0005F44708|nr:PREDICTED: SAP30-binding protein-like [Vollenhovia emeryi]